MQKIVALLIVAIVQSCTSDCGNIDGGQRYFYINSTVRKINFSLFRNGDIVKNDSILNIDTLIIKSLESNNFHPVDYDSILIMYDD
jgi:hypothetical protein